MTFEPFTFTFWRNWRDVFSMKLMTCSHPHRNESGRRRLRQHDGTHDGVARRSDGEGQPQLDEHQSPTPQHADPEGSEQEDSELQGGIGDGRNQYGRSQLLPGEQEGDWVCKSYTEAVTSVVALIFREKTVTTRKRFIGGSWFHPLDLDDSDAVNWQTVRPV